MANLLNRLKMYCNDFCQPSHFIANYRDKKLWKLKNKIDEQ